MLRGTRKKMRKTIYKSREKDEKKKKGNIRRQKQRWKIQDIFFVYSDTYEPYFLECVSHVQNSISSIDSE